MEAIESRAAAASPFRIAMVAPSSRASARTVAMGEDVARARRASTSARLPAPGSVDARTGASRPRAARGGRFAAVSFSGADAATMAARARSSRTRSAASRLRAGMTDRRVASIAGARFSPASSRERSWIPPSRSRSPAGRGSERRRLATRARVAGSMPRPGVES